MNKSKPLCVTGASGFIAGHVVEQLLREGYKVHGTVRDPDDLDKNQFLLDMSARYENRFTLFRASLMEAGSFDRAVENCDIVVHMAALASNEYKKDPVEEVVKPNVTGVRNLVASCQKHNVKRIVYTSSCTTLTAIDKYREPQVRGTPITEDEWVTHASPTYAAYTYSKVQAEQENSKIWKGELVCILPSLTLGPQQHARVTSSIKLIRGLVNKEFGPFVPRLYCNCVDVRDVAAAHVWALDCKETGRFIVSVVGQHSTAELSAILNKSNPSIKASTRMFPLWLMRIAMLWDKRINKRMLCEEAVRKESELSNEKVKKAGFEFRHPDLEKTLADCYSSLLQYGIVKAPPSSSQ